MPEVIVIDEIGTELEAQAARTIAERGVQLIGTAHGRTLENLLVNPTLSDLVGGIQAVTLGDEEARRRGTQKTVLERKAPPTFDVLVEQESWREVIVHIDVAAAVDAQLRGRLVYAERRTLDEQGQVHIAPRRRGVARCGAGQHDGHRDVCAAIRRVAPRAARSSSQGWAGAAHCGEPAAPPAEQPVTRSGTRRDGADGDNRSHGSGAVAWLQRARRDDNSRCASIPSGSAASGWSSRRDNCACRSRSAASQTQADAVIALKTLYRRQPERLRARRASASRSTCCAPTRSRRCSRPDPHLRPARERVGRARDTGASNAAGDAGGRGGGARDAERVPARWRWRRRTPMCGASSTRSPSATTWSRAASARSRTGGCSSTRGRRTHRSFHCWGHGHRWPAPAFRLR